MNIRNVLPGLLAIVLSVILTPRSQADGLDQTLLNISLREDPVYPVPEIGQRRFFCRYETKPEWGNVRMVMRFAYQSALLENNIAGAPGVTEIPATSILQQITAPSIRQAQWVMPWRKRNPGAANLDGPIELIFADGNSGFYQWVVEYETAGITKRQFGDVHSFTVPRRLVFAMMGDSFGSGEGAPAIGSKPWINTAGHRSIMSGGELSLSLFRNSYPNLAFDYVNLTSSGAIAHDIWSETGQSKRDEDGQGISTPQAELLEAFLGKPEKDYGLNSYKHVDAIIMSCGGNDIGFSTIVSHYFGEPKIGIGATAAACIPAGLFGIQAYIKCIALALSVDYSFKEGNEAPFVSEGEWRYFNFYRTRLKTQYEKMEKRLVRDLRPGTDPQRQTSAQVHQVLAIEYPNPLRSCKEHWDINVIAGLVPIPVVITKPEAKEINTQLAVETLNTPVPSSPGLNHSLRGIVEATDVLSTAKWQFIQAGHLMANDGGVCRPNRQFVQRFESYTMAGPNPENNAIHPNRKGHAEIYTPAITAALDNAISPAYRQNRASEEGIKPGTSVLPDPILAGLLVKNFDPNAGQISFQAFVRNHGSVDSSPGKLEIYAQSIDDNISFTAKIGEIAFPAYPPNVLTLPLSFTLTIPNHPAFSQLPIACFTAGSNFNPAAYEMRDRALNRWFGPNSRLLGRISTTGLDSNNQNNERIAINHTTLSEQSYKIGSKITTAELNLVLENFATHRGLSSATVADIRLTNNSDLAFFGFWDPVQKYIEEKGNIISIVDLIGQEGGEKLNPFAEYRNQNLRNFCTGEQGGYLEAALIPYLEGGLNSVGDLGLQPNNDGGSTPIGIQFPGIGGQLIDKTLNIKTPQVAVGIPNYPPGEPITGQRISFNLNVPSKVFSYRVMAGLAASRSDFHDTGMVNARSQGTTPPPAPVSSLNGFPADGRSWFVTIESLLEDGETLLNVYKYDSQPLNARLLSPDEGVLPDGVAPVIRWQPGTAAAEGYRVRIGSTRGGWDIYGVDPLAPGVGDTGVLSSRTTELGMPTLPRDGREIFITLETKRGGVWHAESYRTQTPMSEEPGLLYPAPGSRLGGRAVIRLNAGDPETRELLLFAGSSPGASDLYRGVSKDPSIDDLVWDFALPAPETGLPLIYVTVQSDRDPQRRTQWVFPRSMNSTLLTPSPDLFTPLPLGEVQFTWQRGNNVAGHMLTVGTTPGGNDIAEHLADADGRSTAVRIPSSAIGRLLFVSLHSIRLEGANGLEEYVIPVSSANPLYENDGIDDFMQALFFGPNNPQGAADADFNGNGDSNLIDMLAGIDPRAPGARWDRKAEMTPDGKLLFQMPVTRPGTLYRIERSGNLTDWEDHGAPIEVETTTPDGVIESQRRTGLVQEFYRLKLEPKE
jgi:hypothetical protein